MSDINLRNVSNKTELAILEQNNPDLSALLQIYPSEMASVLINNKDKLHNIAKQMENFTTNTCINTMIMKCSKECVYNNVCILVKNDIAPIGYACITGDSYILCENGEYKQIKDIHSGDIIINIDEKTRYFKEDIVTKIINNGIKDVYEIKTTGGHILQCTNDHLFYSLNSEIHYRTIKTKKTRTHLPKDIKHIWKSIKTGLKKQDRIAVIKDISLFENKELPKDFAKLLGYFITDGSCSKEQTDFCNTNKLFIDEYINICKSLNGYVSSFYYPPSLRKDGIKRKEHWVVISTSGIGKSRKRPIPKDIIKELYRECGLVGITGKSKRIPKQIFSATKQDICDFINRFWSGDGCIVCSNNKIHLTAVGENIKLFEDLQRLFYKIGIHSHIQKKGRNFNISITDAFSINNFFNNVGLIYGKEKKSKEAIEILKTINRSYSNFENDIIWTTIKSITKLEPKEVYDISVKIDHNFIANNIVVHNCPIEKKVIMDMEFDITRSLDIDKNNPIEMEMLWDLIDAKLLDMRSSGALKDGRLTQIVEQKVGQAIVSREELSPNIEAKLELKKLKHSIIDSFVATRRAKKKYGMVQETSALEKMIREAAMNVEDTVE